MIDETTDDAVDFHETGARAKGQYRCADCGYGVTVHEELPTCPMCGGTTWEPAAWTPFLNARTRGWASRTSAVL